MSDRTAGGAAPLSALPDGQKAARAQSFGAVADDYERFRPAPPPEAVDWFLPSRVGRVVDLGAGTGRLTRLLVERADEVVAVDPDERMRAVLERAVPEAVAREGRGEAIPVADGTADVVVAATSWHWMDPVATLAEVERVLVPGGVLAVMWTGPDRRWRPMGRARRIHDKAPVRRPASGGDAGADTGSGSESLNRRMMAEVLRPTAGLEVPPGSPFEEPEHRMFPWEVSFDTEGFIGLLGTFSWVLTLPEADRASLVDDVRNFFGEVRGSSADDTVPMPFEAHVWRSHLRA